VLESTESLEAQETSKFDSFVLLSKWGWKDSTALAFKEADYNTMDGIGGYVKTSPGIRFQWKHVREYRAEDVPKGITYRICLVVGLSALPVSDGLEYRSHTIATILRYGPPSE
jgi:hypothetical protein